MEKTKLIKFINRYYLGSVVEAVVWETHDDTLTTMFISSEQAIMGEVTLKNFKSFEPGIELGILTATNLLRMLSSVGDDINISLKRIEKDEISKAVAIVLTDGITRVDYMLSNLSVILKPKSKKLKHQPNYNFSVLITDDLSDRFIAAKSSLPETKVVTLLKNRDGVYQLIFGYSEINTNRIAIDVKIENKIRDINNPISFSAEYLKEILSANKDADERILEITDEGMAHIHTENADFNADYYLAEVKND